jgi:hypothetical protein
VGPGRGDLGQGLGPRAARAATWPPRTCASGGGDGGAVLLPALAATHPPLPSSPPSCPLPGRKRGWFNFARGSTGGGAGPSGAAAGGGAARGERAPLFSGFLSSTANEEAGARGGGLLASLLRNK